MLPINIGLVRKKSFSVRREVVAGAPEFSVSNSVSDFEMTIAEPPFVPREVLFEKQKYFQSIKKHTYLKGRYDKITSVAIPGALAASCLFMIGKGIYNMSHGIGKQE